MKMKNSVLFGAAVMIFLVVIVGFLSLSVTKIEIKLFDGTIESYHSQFNASYFKKGEPVFVVGPSYEKEAVPKNYIGIIIPKKFLPIEKDTILTMNYGPSKDITQEVKRGIVIGVSQENIFQ